jgi:hypothetical protein
MYIFLESLSAKEITDIIKTARDAYRDYLELQE